MKVIDALIFTPVFVAVVICGHLWAAGRAVAAPVSPSLGIMMIVVLMLSAGVLLARESYAEAQDRKRLRNIDRRT